MDNEEKNKLATKLTIDDIESVIVGETFTVLPSGKVMVCELTLKNDFTVRGEAAVVSKENFVYDKGVAISRERAKAKIWEIEGYLLQQKLFERQL